MSPLGPAEGRGQLIARILAGSWVPSPGSIEISGAHLQELAPILERQGSAGLAWARIRDTPLADTPAGARLRNAFRHHTLQVRVREQQLLDTIEFLRDRGLDPVLAKGWAMSRLYPEPGLRPYGDLDFWVPPGQWREARAALEDPDRPVVPVELHEEFNELGDRGAEALLERSIVLMLEGSPVRVFGAEDHLRLVALHALEHGLARPLWLCDVAVLLETLPGSFDWPLAAQGDEWLSAGFRCALALAGDLFGTDLSAAGVPKRWREKPLPSWLEPAALAAFGAREHYMAAPDPSEVLFQPRSLMKSARLRWPNPIEATFRRQASWEKGPRLPHQLMDFLLRAGSYLLRFPHHLRFLEERKSPHP